MNDTIPLFGPPQPEPVPRPRVRPSTGKPAWTKYRPKNPLKCDDCMQVLSETKGAGPVARQAKWRRRTPDSDRLLCYDHSRQWREHDNLPDLKGGRA